MQNLSKRSVDEVGPAESGHRAQGSSHVAAQAVGDFIVGEDARRNFRKHSFAGEKPQDAIQRVLVRIGLSGQVCDRFGTADEQVGQTEFRCRKYALVQAKAF